MSGYSVLPDGSFTQEDPIGIAGGLNLYGYANGDPVNFSDPFGLCPICPWLVGAAAGAATGVAEGYLLTRALGESYGAGDFAYDATLGAIGGALAVFGRGARLARTAGRQGDEVFRAAQSGGRHSGFLTNYSGRSAREIAKAKRSLAGRIDEHEGFLRDPSSHVDSWDSLRPEHQQSLLDHWRTEIRTAGEQIEILDRIK